MYTSNEKNNCHIHCTIPFLFAFDEDNAIFDLETSSCSWERKCGIFMIVRRKEGSNYSTKPIL